MVSYTQTVMTSTVPSISAVLDAFLADEACRLAPRTMNQYRSVVQLLVHYLNEYGEPYQATGPRRESRRAAGGVAEFCDLYGPDEIAPNVSPFLSYFMVRKVAAGQDLMRAAGTVTRKLGTWLADRELISADAHDSLAERGRRAAQVLPASAALRRDLHAYVRYLGDNANDEQIEDHVVITSVQGSRVGLRGMLDGRELVVVLPARISRRCTVGWSISGVVAKSGHRWRFVDTWNVYPH